MGILSQFFGGGGSAKRAADVASQAQREAAERIAAQQRQIRGDLAPYRQAGTNALEQYSDAVLRGDSSKFFTSPGYQFRFDEGQRALEQSAAGRGGLFSGDVGRELSQYGHGQATQEYGNYLNRLGGLSQTGFSAATQGGQLAMEGAMAQAPYIAQAGQESAGGILGKAVQLGKAGKNILGLTGGIASGGLSSFGGMGGGAAAGLRGSSFSRSGSTPVQGSPWNRR